MNVKGREPHGVIDPKDYETVRNELIAKLEALTDEKGQAIGTKVYRPEDLYPEVRGIAPDLIAYFGNLYWRSVGSVGLGTIHTFENDTGPDDANHAEHGIFVMADLKRSGEGRKLTGLQLMDVAPTILKLFELPVPPDMEGKAVSLDR
jgi:predicted AlkP superfamily phosphohydrolase/phosphomutase